MKRHEDPPKLRTSSIARRDFAALAFFLHRARDVAHEDRQMVERDHAPGG
jgi:hypothetical protein